MEFKWLKNKVEPNFADNYLSVDDVDRYPIKKEVLLDLASQKSASQSGPKDYQEEYVVDNA